MKKMASRLVAH